MSTPNWEVLTQTFRKASRMPATHLLVGKYTHSLGAILETIKRVCDKLLEVAMVALFIPVMVFVLLCSTVVVVATAPFWFVARLVTEYRAAKEQSK